MDNSDKKQGGVAAVDRALSIVDAFQDTDTALSLAQLSKKTGLYKSTILRLAGSLERANYIKRNPEGLYTLGLKPFQLGAMYQRQFRLTPYIIPVLDKLVQTTSESASFWIQEGDRRVCLHRVQSTRRIRDAIQEGDSVLIKEGGAGACIINAFLGAEGERWEQARKSLIAISLGERDPETAAIACPVFKNGHDLAGALSLSGPRYRFETLDHSYLADELLRASAILSEVLGGDMTIFSKITE